MKVRPECLLATLACLFAVGCRSANKQEPIIWIGNSDLHEYDEVVADFENAFVLEPSCHGIKIETHTLPKREYWFLETFSTNRSALALHETEDGISWWMNRNDGEKIGTRFEGHDSSPASAVQHVCFVIKEQGGELS